MYRCINVAKIKYCQTKSERRKERRSKRILEQHSRTCVEAFHSTSRSLSGTDESAAPTTTTSFAEGSGGAATGGTVQDKSFSFPGHAQSVGSEDPGVVLGSDPVSVDVLREKLGPGGQSITDSSSPKGQQGSNVGRGRSECCQHVGTAASDAVTIGVSGSPLNAHLALRLDSDFHARTQGDGFAGRRK